MSPPAAVAAASLVHAGRGLPRRLGAVLGALALLLLSCSAATNDRPSAIEIRPLSVEPRILGSGSAVRIEAQLKNAGGTTLRNVEVGTAISTERSPGMRVSEHELTPTRVPVLSPGSAIPFRSTVRLDGYGWAQVGILVIADSGPVGLQVRRVLVVHPAGTTIELVSLVTMLTATLALFTALVIVSRRSGVFAHWATGRIAYLGLLLLAGAFACWFSLAATLPALPSEAVRPLLYVGHVLFLAGWVALAFGTSTRLTGWAIFAAIGSYVLSGVSWVVLFFTWVGVRPTDLASSAAWGYVLIWPLHAAQALLGLTFG